MNPKHAYVAVPTDVEAAEKMETSDRAFLTQQTAPRKRFYDTIFGCTLLSMVLASFCLGRYYDAAMQTMPSWAETLPRAPVGFVKQNFEYVPEFGAAPLSDNSTEAVWDELVPLGQGFVKDPVDPTRLSAISVVHQLHCLYAIRRKAFAHGTPSGVYAHHMDPSHLRHCFDYLRQALLCHSDPTLEPWNDRVGGVTGWGVDRVCRDYSQLKAWAEARRVNDRIGFVEVGKKHSHQHGSKKHDDDDEAFTTVPGESDGDEAFTTIPGKGDGNEAFTTSTDWKDEDQAFATIADDKDKDEAFTTIPDKSDNDEAFTTIPDEKDKDEAFTTVPDGNMMLTTELE